MRKTVILSLVAAALAVGGAAVAQPVPARVDRAPLTRAAVEQHTAAAFARMDANHDGVLGPADREARQKSVFDRVDADHDGQLSFAEFNARREGQREKIAGHREARTGHRGPGAHGFALHGHRGPGGMLRGADGDADGTITQAEFTNAALTRFDRADTDKDGVLSVEERHALRAQFRGPPRGKAS